MKKDRNRSKMMILAVLAVIIILLSAIQIHSDEESGNQFTQLDSDLYEVESKILGANLEPIVFTAKPGKDNKGPYLEGVEVKSIPKDPAALITINGLL